MVAVSHPVLEAAAPKGAAGWLDTLAGVYPDDDRSAFEAALAYARERCGSLRGRDGELLIDRAIGTAMIVAGLKLDAGTVRAALLIGLAGAHAFDAEDVAAAAFFGAAFFFVPPFDALAAISSSACSSVRSSGATSFGRVAFTFSHFT